MPDRTDLRSAEGQPAPKAREARFYALLAPHLDRLLMTASRRTGPWADAEDLVQECCLRAWLGFDGLRESAAGYVWLLSILDGVIADHYRKAARRQVLAPLVDLDEAALLAVASQDQSPCEQAIADAEAGALQAALRSLPEVFAQPLMLHDFEGLRYREIAELLTLPIGTVMSRLARGRRMLAQLLSPAQERESAALPARSPA